MKWLNASDENPGHTVYYAIPARDPNVLYVIRQKRKTVDFKPVGWRVFARPQKGEPLKTIYDSKKLAEAKKFVQEWEDVVAAS